MIVPATTRGACLTLLIACAAAAQAKPETAVNAFACALYAELADADENLFFSPFSIGTALTMTAEGARGETALQMGKALGLDPALERSDALRPWDWSPMHAGLAQLAARIAPEATSADVLAQLRTLRAELDRANATMHRATSFDDAHYALGRKAEALAGQINGLQEQIDPTEFRSANALWVEQSFLLQQPYLDLIAHHYRTGGTLPIDFRGDAEAGRIRINDWVSTQTNGRITDLLAPGMVDETTRLVLTNAVYFLGEWLEPFDRARTRSEKFQLRDGGSVDVALMRARKSDAVRYAAFNADGSLFATPRQVDAADRDGSGRYPAHGFQIVELPYRGNKLSMQLVLPASADGLAALETMLTAENLERWSRALDARSVDVALPKFRMDTSFELSSALQALGMTRAFVSPADAAGGAQFDGISASDDPARRLYIGAVVHKAFVQVDEKGTEAAAATAVSMVAGAAMPTMVDFTPVFRADRPFVFLIREKVTGTVLFIGRLARPESR